MHPEYATRYGDLYERHWWWRAREQVILDALARYRPAGGWGAALDVGCGDGLFFDRLGELAREVEGVEPDAGLVSEAGPYRSRIHLGPFDRTFRPGKRYSLIVMLDVLEHLPAPAEALGLARELLEPGGALLVTVPALRALWTHHDDLNHHLTRYTRRELEGLLAQGGFEIRELRYFFYWTAPAKLLVRLAERGLRLPARPAGVPPGPINRALYLLSRLEERTLGRIGLPFGSSLIAMATVKG
jgi:SAM-dependent methyltransferase